MDGNSSGHARLDKGSSLQADGEGAIDSSSYPGSPNSRASSWVVTEDCGTVPHEKDTEGGDSWRQLLPTSSPAERDDEWQNWRGASLHLDDEINSPSPSASVSSSSLGLPPAARGASPALASDGSSFDTPPDSNGASSSSAEEVGGHEQIGQFDFASSSVPVATPLPSAHCTQDEEYSSDEEEGGGSSMHSSPNTEPLHVAEVRHADVVEPTSVIPERRRGGVGLFSDRCPGCGGEEDPWKKRRRMLACAVTLVVLAVGISLGVALAPRGGGESAASPSASEQDSNSSFVEDEAAKTPVESGTSTTSTTTGPQEEGAEPQPFQSERVAMMRQFLLSPTTSYGADAEGGSSALFDPASPQYQALSWLADEDLAALSPFVQDDQYRIVQRYALATLYFATEGNGWYDSAKFLSEAEECEWMSDEKEDLGVLCNDEGRATLLKLDRNNLRGTLPGPELALLSPSMLELYSAHNRLSGTLPTELGRLQKLKRIHLHGNKLSGPLPAELGSFPVLKFLRLDDNKLSGMLPPELGTLVGLDTLDLDTNRLTGTVPVSFVGLRALSYLNLRRNFLTGSIEFICEKQQLIISTLSVDLDEVACSCCTCC